MSKDWTKRSSLLVAGIAAASIVVLTGCESKSTISSWQANGTPVHTDPSEPWWNYKLVYHPNAGVYYEPYSHTWHWQENGEWRSAKVRPEPVTWRPEEAIIVKMNWDTPEYGHHAIAMRHPVTKRGAWERTNPMTAPAGVSVNDSTLTSATESESSMSPDESDSISLGPTPNKTLPEAGSTASANDTPSSELPATDTPSSEPSTTESSTVAGASSEPSGSPE